MCLLLLRFSASLLTHLLCAVSVGFPFMLYAIVSWKQLPMLRIKRCTPALRLHTQLHA